MGRRGLLRAALRKRLAEYHPVRSSRAADEANLAKLWAETPCGAACGEGGERGGGGGENCPALITIETLTRFRYSKNIRRL